MIVIYPKKNEPFDKVLRRFSRKVKKSGLIPELKRRQYYEKPSVARAKRKNSRKTSRLLKKS